MTTEFDELLKKLQQEGSKKEYKPVKKETTMKNALTYIDATKEGIYEFRILPDRKNPMDLPFHEINRHWWTNPLNKEKKASYQCSGPTCPMCSLHKKEVALGNEKAWIYAAQKRYIYYGMNREGKLALITTSYYEKEEIKKKIIAQLKAGTNILDTQDGKWVKLIVKKIGGKYKYIVSIEENSVIPKSIKEQFLDLKPLSDFYSKFSDDDLSRVMKGLPIEKELVASKSKELVASKSKELTEAKPSELKENLKKLMDMDDSDTVDEVDTSSFLTDTESELDKLAEKEPVKKAGLTKSKLSSLWDDDSGDE